MPFAELAALIAPPACAACGAPLKRAHVLVCPACMREVAWIGSRGCRRCGLPHHGGRACPAWDAPFETAWAPVAYEGPARDLLHALKFRGALPLAALLAAQIAANAPPWAVGGAEAVVAVPPSAQRRRQRGFDPAERLGRGVASRLGLPFSTCLRRDGRASRQLGAGRAE